ncbi:MAG TPA: SPOR domain-containing protein [Usitatibacter sp.]
MLLVVFVPMILDSEPRAPRNAPALEIPPKDKAPALPAPAPPKPAATLPSALPAEPQAAPSVPAMQAVPAPAAPAAQATPALEGFAVQVGAFKDEEKLKLARDKLAAAGIRHYIERRTGGLTRLRAGPFPTREAADKALAAVRGASLDGQVVPLP